MKDQTLELAAQQAQPLAKHEPSVADMLQAVISGGVTDTNVAALEKLVGLYERMEIKKAQTQFAADFVALQSDIPPIVAKSVIPNRGKYEKFEDIMHVVAPLLVKHHFSVSFSQTMNDIRITETCRLLHAQGHYQDTPFTVRVGGRADSDTQADCKASTTARRNALCRALNIVIRQDCLNEEEDAGIEGNLSDKITPQQADELERRCQMVNAKIPDFLAYAKSSTFKDIAANKYDELDKLLQRKERAGR